MNNVDDIPINLPIDKNKVRQASKFDRVLKKIYVKIINGWCSNSKKKFPTYYQLCHELTICDELLFRDS